MANKLKPCPFCGTEWEDVTYPKLSISVGYRNNAKATASYQVVCWGCKTKGPVAKTEKAATRKWNRRCCDAR